MSATKNEDNLVTRPLVMPGSIFFRTAINNHNNYYRDEGTNCQRYADTMTELPLLRRRERHNV
jgi:hypothetical protein